MKAKRVAPFLVVACALIPNARGDEAKDVLKKLQGTWIYTDAQGVENRWVFEGDTLKSIVGGNEYISTFTLNPKAEPQPTADFKITQAPGDSLGKTALGIYRLEGDNFALCVAHPGNLTRPTEFKGSENEMLFELKRAK
jgi:uncharacterized protein (TIGR03067 family)